MDVLSAQSVEASPEEFTFEELSNAAILAKKTIRRPINGSLIIKNAAGDDVANIYESSPGRWLARWSTGCVLSSRQHNTSDGALDDAMEVLKGYYRVIM